MKNRFILLSFSLISSSLLLVGCGEQTCSYCGLEKHCSEYTVLETTRYICNDCMNNPSISASGNVILDYASEYVDPSLYGVASLIQNSDDTTSDTETAVDGASEDSVLNEVSDLLSDIISTPSEAVSENQVTTVTSVFDSITALLASDNLSLVQSEEDSDLYTLFSGEDSTKVTFSFKGLSSDKPALTISLNDEADTAAFTKACINSSIGFIGSTDYNGLGYEIFTTANQYGNYTYDDCGFYYIKSSEKEIEEGSPLIKYQISFR